MQGHMALPIATITCKGIQKNSSDKRMWDSPSELHQSKNDSHINISTPLLMCTCVYTCRYVWQTATQVQDCIQEWKIEETSSHTTHTCGGQGTSTKLWIPCYNKMDFFLYHFYSATFIGIQEQFLIWNKYGIYCTYISLGGKQWSCIKNLSRHHSIPYEHIQALVGHYWYRPYIAKLSLQINFEWCVIQS